MRYPGPRLLVGALCCLLQATPVLADGTQTGMITGTVFDPQGTSVQGVIVSLEGPQFERESVTDPEGRFRFPALGIGPYRVGAELLGLEAVPHEVMVYVNKTTDLRLDLREPAGEDAAAAVPVAQDWIQVVAEAPVIDRFETRVGAGVSLDFLETLPAKRFYQSVALLLPGVAGGEDGNPNTSGALRSANLFLVDGVDTTDPTTGLFGLNLAYEAVEQVEVTTAAAAADYGRSSGAVINVVTRSGTNAYRGQTRWVMGNNDWNSRYSYPGNRVPHLRPELEAANAGPDDLNSTLALSLGGPVWTNRLFFFASWEDAQHSFLHPTAVGELWDEDSSVESGAFKLTWQPNSQHTLVGQHTYDSARFAAFAPFDRRPAENLLPEVSTVGGAPNLILDTRPGDIFALEKRDQAGRFTKLQWNAVVGQNFSFALNLADQERDLKRGALNRRGLNDDAPLVAIVSTEGYGDELRELYFLFNGVTSVGFEKRPRRQGNLAVEWFLPSGGADHELAMGIDYQETESQTLLNVAGRPGFDRVTGVATAGQLFLGELDPTTGELFPFGLLNFQRLPQRDTREQTLALYLSDTISLRRWLIRFGLRYEAVRGADDVQRLVDDRDVAPRIALSFDPGGDGKVLLSAAWGRYYEPFLQKYIDLFDIPYPLSGYTEYYWNYSSSDCGLGDTSDLRSPCWIPYDVVPPIPIQAASPSTPLERSAVDELVVGFERQLSANAGLSLHWIDRRWRDLWDDLFSVDADGNVVAVVTQLPQARRSYEALQLLFQRRYAKGWQLLASYTWSRAQGNLFQNDGLSTFADFADVTDLNFVNRYGPAPYDRPHQLGLFGSYQFPLERVRLTLASALRYRDGTPYQRETLEDAGIRFLTPRGSERLSGVFQWDVSCNLGFRLAQEFDFEIKTEIFNVTGENRQLGTETLADTGLYGYPRSLGDLQAPRSYRLTLGLRF
ncbi:MAG: TonB-dependent receptor [bacterium]|nr:TonB-dependent receptor [bacterium]